MMMPVIMIAMSLGIGMDVGMFMHAELRRRDTRS